MTTLITKIARKKRAELILKEVKKMWLVKFLNKHKINCIGIDTFDIRNNFYIRANAEKIPFKRNSFDCAIAKEVIEHILPKSHNKIKRVLKPNTLYFRQLSLQQNFHFNGTVIHFI